MRDISSQELVAIKLIPRPIPKAIIPQHVFREIKVRLDRRMRLLSAIFAPNRIYHPGLLAVCVSEIRQRMDNVIAL